MSCVKMVKLTSADLEVFEVDETVALQSETVKAMLEESGDWTTIPLPNVSGKILARVLEYCKYHVNASRQAEESGQPTTRGEDEKLWDGEFVNVDQTTLFDVILAANYMNIKPLLDVTCQAVADLIKGKTTEEIRKHFNIKNDFTPEEEEEVARENQWAFE